MKLTKILLYAAVALLASKLNAGSFGGGGGTPPAIILQEESGGWSNVSRIFTDIRREIDPETGHEIDVPVFPRVLVESEELTRVLTEGAHSRPIMKLKVEERVAYFHAVIVDLPNRRLHGQLYFERIVTLPNGEQVPSVDRPITVNLFDANSLGTLVTTIQDPLGSPLLP